MLAGNPTLRVFDLPVPDPPKSLWKEKDSTQEALAAKAIGFNCLNYDKAAEPSLQRHTLPDKSFIDSNCKDGIRIEAQFPACWNGKDTESIDNSHIKYPSLVNDGTCPKGYETRLVSLFYETIWNTAAFKGVDGRFVLSYGDTTGCGYHADFLEGWDDGVLQSAINQCTSETGLQSDCPLFTIQDESVQNKCHAKIPDIIKNENTHFIENGLPGECPITGGNDTSFPLSLQSPSPINLASAIQIGSPSTGQPTPSSAPSPTPTPTQTGGLWSNLEHAGSEGLKVALGIPNGDSIVQTITTTSAGSVVKLAVVEENVTNTEYSEATPTPSKKRGHHRRRAAHHQH